MQLLAPFHESFNITITTELFMCLLMTDHILLVMDMQEMTASPDICYVTFVVLVTYPTFKVKLSQGRLNWVY